MVLALGIVRASLKILGIGIGVKKVVLLRSDPQVAVVWPKKRGILVVALNNFATLCAVWQKIVKV